MTCIHPTRLAAEQSLIDSGWHRRDEDTFGHGRALACVELGVDGFVVKIWRRA
jgi:hypothetical protein